jgi:hypothetical protein
MNKSPGMRYFRSLRTGRRQSRAHSATGGVASDGKDENRIAAQQASCIIAGGKKNQNGNYG